MSKRYPNIHHNIIMMQYKLSTGYLRPSVAGSAMRGSRRDISQPTASCTSWRHFDYGQSVNSAVSLHTSAFRSNAGCSWLERQTGLADCA